MNKKVLIIVIIAVAVISISAAVYTISPLFISNTVNEPLPNITTTTTTTNSINQKAASLEYQKFISMNQQDIMNTAKQMNQSQKNMIMIGAAQVNNTVNENIAPAVESNNLQTNKSSGSIIRTGSFVGAGDGFHNAEGIAKLIPLKDRSNILRLENFKSTNGPDVHIYLSTDKTISDPIDLGKLKANNGNQNYDIPIGTNLPKYKIVLIWCKPFSVLFGSAELMT